MISKTRINFQAVYGLAFHTYDRLLTNSLLKVQEASADIAEMHDEDLAADAKVTYHVKGLFASVASISGPVKCV